MFRYGEYIRAIYEEKSFVGAANRLHISQSSLSLTIKKAEDRIGARIFNRDTHPLTLTPFGKKYMEALDVLQHQEELLKNFIADSQNLKNGSLNIAAGASNIAYILPPILAEYHDLYPNITVHFYEKTLQDIHSIVARGEIDLFFSTSFLDQNIYRQYRLFHERLFLVIPTRFTTKTQRDLYSVPFSQILEPEKSLPSYLPLEEVKDIPFVLLRTGNDIRTRAMQLLNDGGVQPHILYELDQSTNAYLLSINGIGATVISDLLIHKMGSQDNVIYFRLRGPVASRYNSLYIRRDKPMTHAMKAFIDVATSDKIKQSIGVKE